LLGESVRGTPYRRTAGAQAPENYFGFVDNEAARVSGLKTRRGPDRAVDVVGTAAQPAYDVVVVIGDAPFESGGVPGWLDSPEQPGVGART
jgi:hypothetical protein